MPGPSHREAFVSKCASLIQQGIGVVILDIVTDRVADLHRDLLHRLNENGEPITHANLWAGSYHPVNGDDDMRLEIWHEGMTLGTPLPALPFWLKDGPCIRLDLEATYERTRHEQRMTQNGS